MTLKNSLEFNKTSWSEQNNIFWNLFTFHEVYEWSCWEDSEIYQNWKLEEELNWILIKAGSK